MFLPPESEANVFTGVCLSTGRGTPAKVDTPPPTKVGTPPQPR